MTKKTIKPPLFSEIKKLAKEAYDEWWSQYETPENFKKKVAEALDRKAEELFFTLLGKNKWGGLNTESPLYNVISKQLDQVASEWINKNFPKMFKEVKITKNDIREWTAQAQEEVAERASNIAYDTINQHIKNVTNKALKLYLEEFIGEKVELVDEDED